MDKTRSSWLVDGNRFATKIKSVSGTVNPERLEWQSNPTRPCPSCLHFIDNSDVAQMWPGLPSGVKFDPSDQEIIVHLLAKAGIGESKTHPFIDEFIPTVSEDDGICYTHPQKLPAVKQDGSASHFFHRAIKAYNTGTRKRRKINDADFGDVRWHKTGKTKPVMLNGVQRGCKKIMVLYTCSVKGGKPEKTNWVMHQYHHGTDENEKDGEYVISKIYYQQQQQMKTSDISCQDIPESNDVGTVEINPITPKSVTPGPPRMEGKCVNVDSGRNVTCTDHLAQDTEIGFANGIQTKHNNMDHNEQVEEENHTGEVLKWCDIESQDLLDSQQLIEALSLCDDLLQSHSPGHEVSKSKASLSDYAQLGSEHLKKDLERQDHVVDPLNTEIDTPPEFRLSQLEFESDDSYLAWGGTVDQ